MTNDIFISYSWKNKDIADKIYSDLTLIGLNILKDNHNINYTESISDFMVKIRDSKYAILLISDDYLKSTNCMLEVLHLLKDDRVVWDKILPIIIDAKYFEIVDRLNYLKFWEEKEKELSILVKDVEMTNAISTLQELNKIKNISQNIDNFLGKLKDCLALKPIDIFKDSYKNLLSRIDIEPKIEKFIELIPIDSIKSPHKKLKAILNFIKKTELENSACYNILADAYKGLGQKEKAVENYKKAIELNELNYSAWNNLGQVYELFLNYDLSKEAYEKSILANPYSEIPRLNLAVLYKTHFKNYEKAIELNTSILDFDENNASAHSNLASLYRGNDKEKFEKHIKIAVNQDHMNAILMYANYLKVEKKQIEIGNQFYLKAKELDKGGNYKEIIDYALNTHKV